MQYKSKQMITNYQTGKSEHIVVKGPLVPLPDLIIGGILMLFGGGILLTGAFKSGADSFDSSEMDLLSDLDLIANDVSEFK